MSLTPTQDAAETAARETLRGDWDADGTVAVHLPADAARKILLARGWTYGESYGWMSPTANLTYCWETSEALQLALLSEVL